MWSATARAAADSRIRAATEADLPALRAILNHEILTSTASWTATPRTEAAMAGWFAARRADGFPVLVAEGGDAIHGYASYGRFRAGEGYDGTVEHSVYVAEAARRHGVARALLAALIERARTDGLRAMIGGVSADQAASLALHRALGFEQVALVPRIGRKFGRDLDLALMMLRL